VLYVFFLLSHDIVASVEQVRELAAALRTAADGSSGCCATPSRRLRRHERQDRGGERRARRTSQSRRPRSVTPLHGASAWWSPGGRRSYRSLPIA
jgi:hypothetical protein